MVKDLCMVIISMLTTPCQIKLEQKIYRLVSRTYITLFNGDKKYIPSNDGKLKTLRYSALFSRFVALKGIVATMHPVLFSMNNKMAAPVLRYIGLKLTGRYFLMQCA